MENLYAICYTKAMRCKKNIEQNKMLCTTISFEKYIFRLSSSVFELWSYILGKCCYNLHSLDTIQQNYFVKIITRCHKNNSLRCSQMAKRKFFGRITEYSRISTATFQSLKHI